MSETIHIVALPHTETTAEYATCAYTQKVVKLCRMLYGRDRRIILYAGEVNEAPCDEHVICVTRDQQSGWFGKHNEGDLDRGGFNFNAGMPWWKEMNARAALEINKRCEETDLLGIIGGVCQEPIAQAVPFLTACEWGVGYEGVFTHSAFESYAWMHHVYGLRQQRQGLFFDQVIPNFFDPDEFLPVENPSGDYLLYVGRLIEQKGVNIATMIARELDMPLLIAGPGALAHGHGWIQTADERLESPTLEYIGPVSIADRAELMGNAACLLAPTVYIEPFGGVAVEAMMAGTPVVATDFGAFTETVREGVSGYRMRTLSSGVEAVRKALQLAREPIREYALANYSLDAIQPRFENWFDQLDTLWGEGWFEMPTTISSRARE